MTLVKVDYRPPGDLIARINAFRPPRPLHSVWLLFMDHFLIWAPGIAAITFLPTIVLLLCAPFIWLFATRSMRGLECIVHEGSHYNLFVRRPTLGKQTSDFLCNLFAAVPVFSTVQRYRQSHLLHHTDLGFARDPDKIRHEELRLAELDRQHLGAFSTGVASRLLEYIPGWWHAIGTTLFVAFLGVLWHAGVVFILFLLNGSFVLALWDWMFSFAIPFAFLLPIVRFVGEAAKHDYRSAAGVTLETFSNTGAIHRLLVHPHCDGYHTLHHLFPHIPHSRLPLIDRMLRNEDHDNWISHLRERKHILQDA